MKKHLLPLTMIGLLVVAWIIVWPKLPEQIPIHWNVNGEANGFASKLNAMFSTLGIMVILYISMAFLPKVDPRKTNYKYFTKSYHIILNAILGVLFVINILMLANAMGYDVPMGSIGPLVVGIIFMILGNYMPQVRSNFFIGIRTPWTLSSDEVWKKTHRAASKIFFFGGLAMILATFAPVHLKQAILFSVVALTVVAPYIYSYVLFKRKP
ncbi:SdpI family protein [Mesobacillus selenatarsenatis]|uniref:SdpI family protein n=1 Tax=Mesobacillus selenatarsenatis TaxID=388741 RepID=A0A846TXE5_9BACI|nr:SdpI family protein [Mesobacillus selenatarsenatis]NKE07001.1 SdpI family protein [Mesobacillus selenatarsenatis]